MDSALTQDHLHSIKRRFLSAIVSFVLAIFALVLLVSDVRILLLSFLGLVIAFIAVIVFFVLHSPRALEPTREDDVEPLGFEAIPSDFGFLNTNVVDSHVEKPEIDSPRASAKVYRFERPHH